MYGGPVYLNLIAGVGKWAPGEREGKTRAKTIVTEGLQRALSGRGPWQANAFHTVGKHKMGWGLLSNSRIGFTAECYFSAELQGGGGVSSHSIKPALAIALLPTPSIRL